MAQHAFSRPTRAASCRPHCWSELSPLLSSNELAAMVSAHRVWRLPRLVMPPRLVVLPD